MVELNVEIDTRALEKAINIAPRVLKFELADGMDHISRGFLKRFRDTQLQGPPGVRGASGHGLYGTFKRVSLLSATIEGMGMEVFSESKVAKLQETGGVVKAPGGKRLAVPLSARTEMFTTQGKLREQYKRPGQLKNVRAMRLKGETYLAKATKKFTKILPLFVLKRQVRLEPRLGFYRTWDNLTNYRIEILNKSIQNALRKI